MSFKIPHHISFKIRKLNTCDFCGQVSEVLESHMFDNGNASDTQICICKSCLSTFLTNFDSFKILKEEKQ